jgi:hypothetical protein
MTKTMAVVIAVSRRDGHVTLRVSSRTSWRNLNGDVAIQCSFDLKRCSTNPNVVTAATFAQAGRRLPSDPSLAGVAGLEPATPGFGDRK